MEIALRSSVAALTAGVTLESSSDGLNLIYNLRKLSGNNLHRAVSEGKETFPVLPAASNKNN